MTLRLTEEENAYLDELAAAEGRSKQDVLRLALVDRWSRLRKDERLDEAVGRVLPRYRALLDSMGTE